jgi:hypothetical protein
MGWFLRRIKSDVDKLIDLEFAKVREAIVAEIQGLRLEAQLIEERSSYAAKKLFDLEGRIAALEATSHRVSYVPVDAMKGLKAEDIENMNDVPEKVKDTLRDIVDLQEKIREFQDLDNFDDIS